jgi:hypothetical protein
MPSSLENNYDEEEEKRDVASDSSSDMSFDFSDEERKKDEKVMKRKETAAEGTGKVEDSAYSMSWTKDVEKVTIDDDGEEEANEDEEDCDEDADINHSDVLEYALSQHIQHSQAYFGRMERDNNKDEEDGEGEEQEDEDEEYGSEEGEGEGEGEVEEEDESIPTQVLLEEFDDESLDGSSTQLVGKKRKSRRTNSSQHQDLVADVCGFLFFPLFSSLSFFNFSCSTQIYHVKVRMLWESGLRFTGGQWVCHLAPLLLPSHSRLPYNHHIHILC